MSTESRAAACRLLAAALGVAAAVTAPAVAGDGDDAPRRLTADDLRGLSWRSVGPANMGGRVAAIALAPADAHTIFVGYATGGVWKTTNNGTTFEPVFDDKETASIGSLAVCDAPPDWPGWDEDAGAGGDEQDRVEAGRARIVWVGTGEGNGRNSSSWGHGVYRSTDGGGSFEHLGLEDTHDIPALAVDPRDPDVCYVAALGHLWGPNEQRGLFKTEDGGKTWRAALQIDERTGACDVIIDPQDPDTVFAAMYDRRRTPWSYRSGGPEGGIYRSRDAGGTWEKLTDGLPERTGRIGLDIHHDDPRIVYACVESADDGPVGDSWTDRSRGGGVFRSGDGGDTWTRTSDLSPRPFYFSRIKVDPRDPDRVYLPGWEILVSDDGGRTFYAGVAKAPHVDYHAMVIDPADTDHLLVGNDGGLYVSWDRGRTWDFHNHMAVGQFYNVSVDDSDPYRIGGGLQDNGTWIGPSATITQEPEDTFMGRGGAITNRDWQFVYGGDGFHVAFDPEDPDVVYAESQGGYVGRVNLRTGEHLSMHPVAREGEPRLRFNWNAPFFVSPHDASVLYLGGNHVFRFEDRGARWEMISPDLSRREPEKIVTVGSDAETYGTVVSLAESPLEEGLLWAGTDDGLVHVSRDGGGQWDDVTPGEVDGLYVACIEASAHDAQRAYVAVDGHRSDVFEPILLATGDGGASWRSIVGDLPDTAPVDVVREDPRNGDVLYAGTEQAAYVTIDGGAHWVKLNGKTLPTVRVDDLKIQPREMDLVAGTHGRSVYVLDDVSPLSQMDQDVLDAELHLFEPMPGRPRQLLGYGGLWSDRMFIAKNPPPGTAITYWLRDHSRDPVKITIADEHGRTVRKLDGPAHGGLNRVAWDLQPDKRQQLTNPHGMIEFVPAGTYKITVKHGDHEATTTVEVLP